MKSLTLKSNDETSSIKLDSRINDLYLALVIFNFEVDIFSYGIWLYELMSGCRPYHLYRTQTEIKEAVRQGTRPILADVGVNPHLPSLEFIMRVWIMGSVFI